MTIVRWEPLRELGSLQNEMNRLFNTVFDAPAPATAARCAAGCRRWTSSRPTTTSSCAPTSRLREEDVKIEVEDHAHRLGRAQGRAREHERGLLPRRARVRRVLALADPARGRRPRGRRRELRPRRARGPHPEARGAQAAPDRDRRRRPSRAIEGTRGRSARRARRRGAPARRAPLGSPRPHARASRSAPATRGSRARTGHAAASPTARSARPPSSRSPRRRVVKTLEVREVAELGFDMVLGNTFHLFLDAGPRADRAARRPARLHALGPADHHRLRRLPGLLDGPRHRRRRDQGPRGPGTAAGERAGAILDDRGGGRHASAPTSTARAQFMGPETSMEVQAALGSDIALVFDECTPFHVGRDYTARSTERTHRWLDRCLAWHAEHGPTGPARLRDRPGRRGGGPAARVGAGGRGARRSAGSRSAARSAQDKDADVRGRRVDGRGARRGAPAPPARASARSTTSCAASSSGIDTFDCAMPTRIGRHGMARRPRPGEALARRPRQGPLARRRRAGARGLPVPGLRARLQPRLPALPAQGARADRPAAAHDPQPRLPAAR